MTKQELVEWVWKENQELTKKTVSDVIEATFDSLSKGIKKDGRFTYPGFGTWTVRKRKARTGRNPRTGEPLMIQAARLPAFRAGRALKDKVRR